MPQTYFTRSPVSVEDQRLYIFVWRRVGHRGDYLMVVCVCVQLVQWSLRPRKGYGRRGHKNDDESWEDMVSLG